MGGRSVLEGSRTSWACLLLDGRLTKEFPGSQDAKQDDVFTFLTANPASVPTQLRLGLQHGRLYM